MQQLQLSEATAAQRRIFFHAVDATDGIAAETALTGTGWFSKNGAAPAASTGSISELSATNMPGRYYIEATATELNAVGIIEFRYKAAACAEVIARAQVVPFDPYDAVRMGLTALPNAAAEAAGGLYTRGTGAGQINQNANGQVDIRMVALLADVITAAGIADNAFVAANFAAGAFDAVWSVAARILTANTNFNDPTAAVVADAVWDELLTAHVLVGSFGQALNALGARTGEVADAGPTTTDFDVDGFTEASNDHFNGMLMVFTTGALIGQSRVIADYVGAGQNCIFDEPWTEAPADNDDFVIVPTPRTVQGLRIPELPQQLPPATPFFQELAMLLYHGYRDETITSATLHSIKNDAGVVVAKQTLADAAGVLTRSKMVTGP